MLKLENKTKKKRVILLILVFSFFFYLSRLPDSFTEDQSALLVIDRNEQILRAFLNEKDQYQFANASDTIPEKLKQAILYYEDEYFEYHPGFNPVSILKAALDNLSEFRVKRGASTITMQVARIMDPKSRTFFNKFKELFQSINIELNYSKDEILLLYANNAPYGKNFVGYTAASLFYFNKFPNRLSWSQSALLAVLPNAPGLIHPSKNTDKLKQKRDKLLKKLFENELIDKQTYTLAIKERIENKIYYPDKMAYHFTEFIKRHKAQGIVKTTLDKRMQRIAESQIYNYMTMIKNQQIHNASALIVDTKSSDILAYVGSQNYWDIDHNGMVDGVFAKRSSGSVLKPFLYAMAIDQGYISPKSLIKDIPSYYQGFSPNNANEKFAAYVSAEDALVKSLNVPAVRLLNMYGIYPFYRNLKSIGVNTLFRDADDYGLSLILGGSEVSLWDMVKIYSGMGRLGRFSDLNYFPNSQINTKNYFSPMAWWQTLDILKKLNRPGSEYYWDDYVSGRPIAWKTGTSYGQKDAWAIGTSPNLTIGVWTGNFSGKGNPNLAGAKSSGPLMFTLYKSLDTSFHSDWFERPDFDGIEKSICTVSGFLATDFCESKKSLEANSKLPLRKCHWHYRLFLSKDEKFTVCSLCWTEGYIEKNMLIPPADVALQLRKNGINYDKKPPHKLDCKNNVKLKISVLYPEMNSVLAIPKDYQSEQMKIVSVVSHEIKSVKLYWYLNDEFLGQSDDNKMAFSCYSGNYELRIIDEYGNKVSTHFKVLEEQKKN